jgi:hypothetical protein
MGNHSLIDPLYYFLDVNRHLNIRHVFFIQTDITRSIRDKFLDFNKFAKDKNNNLKQIIRYMYDDVYSKLKKELKSSSINDEGALQTSLSDEDVLKTISKFKNEVNIGNFI